MENNEICKCKEPIIAPPTKKKVEEERQCICGRCKKPLHKQFQYSEKWR